MDDESDVRRLTRQIERAEQNLALQQRVLEEQERAADAMREGPLQKLKLNSVATARDKAEVGRGEVAALKAELDRLSRPGQGHQHQQTQHREEPSQAAEMQRECRSSFQTPAADLGLCIEDYTCSVSESGREAIYIYLSLSGPGWGVGMGLGTSIPGRFTPNPTPLDWVSPIYVCAGVCVWATVHTTPLPAAGVPPSGPRTRRAPMPALLLYILCAAVLAEWPAVVPDVPLPDATQAIPISGQPLASEPHSTELPGRSCPRREGA